MNMKLLSNSSEIEQNNTCLKIGILAVNNFEKPYLQTM